MNQQQYKEARAILAEDCTTAGFYYNAKALNPFTQKLGCTCAIGALAAAAGVSQEVLSDASIMGIAWFTDKETNAKTNAQADAQLIAVRTISSAITKKFGLTLGEQEILQDANDSICGSSREIVDARRLDVLHALERIFTGKPPVE